jgi:TonB family protein
MADESAERKSDFLRRTQFLLLSDGVVNPSRIWSVSAAVSFGVHAALVFAVSSDSWGAGRSASRYTPRDIRFLVDALHASREPLPAEAGGRAAPFVVPSPAVTPHPTAARPDPRPTGSPAKPGTAPSPASPAPAPAAHGGAASAPPPVAVDPRLAEAIAGRRKGGDPVEDVSPLLRFYIHRVRGRIADSIHFPDAASRLLSGWVRIQVVIDRAGAVREIRYLTHADHPVLDVIAEQAIRRGAPYPALEGIVDLEEIVLNIPFRFGP